MLAAIIEPHVCQAGLPQTCCSQFSHLAPHARPSVSFRAIGWLVVSFCFQFTQLTFLRSLEQVGVTAAAEALSAYPSTATQWFFLAWRGVHLGILPVSSATVCLLKVLPYAQDAACRRHNASTACYALAIVEISLYAT